MTLSAKSLHRSGSISDKQMAKLQVLRGTKAQKSKMAPFMQKTKDEGDPRNKGVATVRVNQINGPDQDKGGKYGTPSKGGSSRQDERHPASPRDAIAAITKRRSSQPAATDQIVQSQDWQYENDR